MKGLLSWHKQADLTSMTEPIMNTHQILKNDEATSRSEIANLSDKNEVATESQENQNGPVCKNGVCLVNWKPQRPAAA